MSDRPVVSCVGSGDAFGSGGRLNSCYHLAAGNEQLLLDCGCSVLIGLQRCNIDPAGIDIVVISHLHGDHFGGIPFLLLEAKYVSHRQRPLTLIGPAGLQRQVEAALEALYPGVFNDGLGFPLVYLQLTPGQTLWQGSFEIDCCRVRHGSSPDVFALRVAVAGKVLCYSGDTEWTESLVALADNSDLLIAECTAYAEPIPSHLDYSTLLRHQDRLNCRRLLLTHTGPEVLEKRSDLQLEIVDDGDIMEL